MPGNPPKEENDGPRDVTSKDTAGASDKAPAVVTKRAIRSTRPSSSLMWKLFSCNPDLYFDFLYFVFIFKFRKYS